MRTYNVTITIKAEDELGTTLIRNHTKVTKSFLDSTVLTENLVDLMEDGERTLLAELLRQRRKEHTPVLTTTDDYDFE